MQTISSLKCVLVSLFRSCFAKKYSQCTFFFQFLNNLNTVLLVKEMEIASSGYSEGYGSFLPNPQPVNREEDGCVTLHSPKCLGNWAAPGPLKALQTDSRKQGFDGGFFPTRSS